MTKTQLYSCKPTVLLLVVLLFAISSFAATGKTVHAFVSLANGANPQSNVISDSLGNLYGTTYFGGARGFGEVFELTPSSSGKFTQKVIYSFAGGPQDGSYPWAALTLDSAGNLYGTTAGGGTGTVCGNSGCGTVFKLSPKSGGGWTETVLFSFLGGNGGTTPEAGVVFDSAGNLYGATFYKDSFTGYGVVYKLSPSSPTWTETVLYTFAGGSDGYYPTTTPVFDSAGNLYGTTSSGVVYELSPGTSGWTKKAIQNFSNGLYTNVIFDAAGNLYGLASDSSCGQFAELAFELSPSSGTWTEKTLYCFGLGVNNDAQAAEGTIAFDAAGNLYGTSFEGGTLGFGTVFQLVPSATGRWTEHIIKNFTNGPDGEQPVGGVAFDPSGNLYATAYSGDLPACLYSNYGGVGCGSVIQLTPRSGGPWPSITISHFGSTDASFPAGGLIADSAGNYYGTGTQGGSHGGGEVFRLSPNANGSWTRTVLYDFTGINGDGLYPSGNLAFDSAGNLYGTTQLGGNLGDYCNNFYPGCGTAYKLTPTASGPWTEKVLYTFSSAVGGNPYAGVTIDHAGNLFGTTLQGGPGGCFLQTSGCGSVFELTPGSGGTWTESTLYQFTGNNDGGNPYAGVTLDSAGNLYGTTSNGGIYFFGGTAYKLAPATGGAWAFSVLHTFGGVDGDVSIPTSSLVFDTAGNLYGTGYGPLNTLDGGVVYKLSPSSGDWTTTILHAFTGKPDGNSPQGGVVFDAAGNLYGTTTYGGKSLKCLGGCGTVFSLTPSSSGWSETVLYSFTNAGDGSAPSSPVTVDAAGHIFTTAPSGGGGHQGTVFEVIP